MNFSSDWNTLRSGKIYSQKLHPKISVNTENTTDASEPSTHPPQIEPSLSRETGTSRTLPRTAIKCTGLSPNKRSQLSARKYSATKSLRDFQTFFKSAEQNFSKRPKLFETLSAPRRLF